MQGAASLRSGLRFKRSTQGVIALTSTMKRVVTVELDESETCTRFFLRSRQPTMRSPHSRLLLGLWLSSPFATSAQTFIWTGATDGNWATGTNWDAGAPASSTTTVVTFNTTTQLATTNNMGGGLTLNTLTFGANSGARTVGGNALNFDGAAPTLIDLATAGHVTLSAPLTLASALTVTGGPMASAQLFLDGTVSGSGGLTLTSGSTVVSGANTYTGATVVENSAQLGLSRTGALGTSSGISVGLNAHLQIIRSNSTTATAINRPLNLAGLLTTASQKIDNLGFALRAATYSGAITLSGNGEIRAFGATGSNFNSVELGITGTVDRAGNTLKVSTGGFDNTVRFTNTVSGNGGTTLQPDGGDIIFAGAVSGHGNITVSGAAGTVSLAALAGDGALNVGFSSFSGSVTVSGALTGARDLTVSSGTLVLSSASNTFTGAINLSGGTLQAPTESRLGNAANTIALSGGGALSLTSSGSLTRAIATSGLGGSVGINGLSRTISSTITGDGGFGVFNFGLGGIVTLSGTNTFTGGLSIIGNTTISFTTDANLGAANGGVKLDGGSLFLPGGYGTLFRPVEVALGNGGIGGTTGAAYTLAGNITGAGRLDLGGAATFTLAGNNSHTGGVTLAGNTNAPTILVLDSDARLGGASGVLNLGRTSGASILPGTLRAGADLTLAATRSTTFRDMTVDTNGHTVVFNQPIAGRGMTKTGAGVWTLNTANTDASGDNFVTIEEGTLRLGVNDALGSRARISFLADGGVLDLNGRSLELMNLDNVAATGEVRLGGGTLTLTTGASGLAGSITGAGAVVLGKSGFSSLGFDLSGNNTFTGGLTLQEGASLQMQNGNPFGAPGNALTMDNGTISIGTLAAAPLTIDGASNLTIAAAGGRFVAGGQSIVIASQLSGSNPIQFSGGSFPGEATSYDVRLTNPANTFTGQVQLGDAQTFGSAMLGLVADGSLGNAANVLTLGSRFFDGEITKSARGGLRAYANITLPDSRTIRLEGSSSASDDRGGVFDTNGHTITIAGAIGQITVGMPLLKTGAGTLLLNGTNTFTGLTTVQEGTLGGTGSLAGGLEVQGGATLAPGASAGLLTVMGDLTLLGSSLTVMEVGGTARGTGYDAINIGGAFTADGTLTVSLINGFSPAAGTTFNFFTAGTYSGAFAGVNLPALFPGLSWDSGQLGSAGLLSVAGSAIPEPGTYALIAGCAGLVAALYRRRRAG